MTLADIAKYTDAFYIGGTKNGFLMGEAIVITNNNLKSHFRYQMKQRGALLAKGKLLGIQFSCMFKDNLYFKIAKHTNDMAKLLSKGITDLGYKFLTTPQSNQIFPILPNEIIKHLSEDYSFYEWCKINDNDTCIRLVTSWACKEENISIFINDLNKIAKKCAK
jgi:threonine aldolase